jgi:PilZ domain
MTLNRRRSERLPVGFYVEQIVGDDPHRCFTSDLSSIGLYMERPFEPLERRCSVVQLEIPLPNTSDSIWAKGEVVYDRFDTLFHGTAVRFTGMARFHQRMLREWLRETTQRSRFIGVNPFRPHVLVHRPEPAQQRASA